MTSCNESPIKPGYFDPDKEIPETKEMYIALMSIMGSNNITKLSLRKNIIYTMKLLSITYDRKKDIQIYPHGSGFIAIHDNKEKILNFLKEIFRTTYQALFCKDNIENRFLIRACITYGPTFVGKEMNAKYPFKDKIIIGYPMQQAFLGIHNAPPYGISIDETARIFPPNNQKIPYVYYKWFTPAENPGEKILQYLEWCKQYSNSTLYKMEDIVRHTIVAKEYFSRHNSDTK